MSTLTGLKIWYDPKRRCYSSSVALELAQLYRELIAKGLDPKTAHYDKLPGGGTLKPEDVLLAISFIKSTGAQLLARCKYALQLNYKPDLVTMLFSQMHEISYKEQWYRRPYRPTLLHDLCIVAVDQYLDPHHCSQCNGRGTAKVSEKYYVCDQCNGSGIVPQRNEAEKVPELRHRLWRERYETCLSKLRAWDDLLESALRHYLGT